MHSALSLIALYICIKFHLSSILLEICSGQAYYHYIAKLTKGNNSLINCDRVSILALCTSFDGHLSMDQVSFISLLYFQRYAPDKLFIAKIKKGSNSVSTGDRVMVLAFCNSSHGQCIKFH